MTAFFLVLWNRGGRLALYLNKKDSGEHPFSKKKSRSARADRDVLPNKGRTSIPKHPRLYQCYSIGNIFFVAEAVAVSSV